MCMTNENSIYLQQFLMLGKIATINCIIITFWDKINKI